MQIRINLEKYKEFKKNEIRRERTALFNKLDIDFQRALETGADTSLIVAEKQRLRDITKLVDEAQTLDDVKAIQVK